MVGATHETVPGPRPMTVGGWRGNLLRFYHDPIAYLCMLHRSYGDVAGLVQNNPQRLFVFGSAYNEQLLRNTRLFHRVGFTIDGPENSALHRLGYGLVSMNDEQHKHYRRLLLPAFQGKRIGVYRGDMVAQTARLLDSWDIGEQRDVWSDMARLTQRMIAKVLVGLEHHDADALSSLMQRWLDLNAHKSMMSPLQPPGSPYHRLLGLSATLERLLLTIIARRRADSPAHDVLSLLLGARNEHGASLTDHEIIGQIVILFVAGTEAVYNALTWTFFLLSQHPPVLTDLRDELYGVLRGDAPTIEHFDRLPLLERAIKESMRLFPPASYGVRVAVEPSAWGSYQVPAGATIWFSHYITHRMIDLYPQPRAFLPDRWSSIKPLPHEYMPFGAGPRSCLGAMLATMQLKIVLAMVLQRYGLAMVAGARIDRNLQITLAPKNGMPMTIETPTGTVTSHSVRGNIRGMVDLA